MHASHKWPFSTNFIFWNQSLSKTASEHRGMSLEQTAILLPFLLTSLFIFFLQLLFFIFVHQCSSTIAMDQIISLIRECGTVTALYSASIFSSGPLHFHLASHYTAYECRILVPAFFTS